MYGYIHTVVPKTAIPKDRLLSEIGYTDFDNADRRTFVRNLTVNVLTIQNNTRPQSRSMNRRDAIGGDTPHRMQWRWNEINIAKRVPKDQNSKPEWLS